MTTATQTKQHDITILEGLSYADGVHAVLIDGRGYWVRDNVTNYTVTSDDGGVRYTVGMGLKGRTTGCSCPDATYRRHKCKHMAAVETIAKRW